MKKTRDRLNSKDFQTIVDALLDNAFKAPVSYKPKKDWRE
jgi:sensor histidine kinase regulating citrate/malate metabolism